MFSFYSCLVCGFRLFCWFFHNASCSDIEDRTVTWACRVSHFERTVRQYATHVSATISNGDILPSWLTTKISLPPASTPIILCGSKFFKWATFTNAIPAHLANVISTRWVTTRKDYRKLVAFHPETGNVFYSCFST